MNEANKKNRKNIIDEINEVMQNRNISMSELSNQTNISLSTLYGILKGDVSPRLMTLQDICEGLNLEVAIISSEEELSKTTGRKISKLSPWKRNFVKNMVDLLEREEKNE